MRKVLSFLLCAVLLISLAACEDMTINISFSTPETTEGTVAETVPTTETTEPAASQSGTDGTEPPVKDTNTTPTEHLVPSTDPSEPPVTQSPVQMLWDRLAGCYTCGSDRFVYFTYKDEGPAFLSGFWDNPVPYNRAPASVTHVEDLGGERYVLTLVYTPNEENAADEQDLRPLEYTVALQTDELSKGIVYMETPENSGFEYYTFAGYSYDDAYDASHNVQYATFAQMQEFWSWLTGYWNSDDGRFVCFDQKDSNSLIFMEGIWDSGSRGWADFEKAMSGYMDLPMEFVVYYPPISNELDGDLPGEYVRVIVDWMEVETHGHIFVKMDENGEWIKYTFAGYTEAEAYPNS